MVTRIPRAWVAGVLAIAATTALCLGVTSSASAGTGVTHQYCTNVVNGNGCFTPSVNVPHWTYYTRAEMQGYHCAAGMGGRGLHCGTSNYVYSQCWYVETNPKYAYGVNQSGYTRNMEVWLFHSTGGDC